MPDPKPLTKTARAHHFYMAEAMRRLEWDLQNHLMKERRIPEAWHEIASRKTSAKKQLTVRFDEDVVKFFKSAGPGYQGRMNDVLRSFMHMKLGGFLHGEETIDAFRDGDWAGKDRPSWGETEEMRRKLEEDMADMKWKAEQM
ncbi:BrnA antitoxin family protein [Gymnodinialimonas hymeniacidonis]|uniref:BrnA antitoxin family protein n=1 Tax=Gymnodinialimonas hymeniacidonis TaxID=3126508 RepID=UPI0034C5E1E6